MNGAGRLVHSSYREKVKESMLLKCNSLKIEGKRKNNSFSFQSHPLKRFFLICMLERGNKKI